MSKTLTMRFDVTDLTQVQIDSLLAHLWAQTEEFRDDYPDLNEDGDRSYPDVPVLGHEVV